MFMSHGADRIKEPQNKKGSTAPVRDPAKCKRGGGRYLAPCLLAGLMPSVLQCLAFFMWGTDGTRARRHARGEDAGKPDRQGAVLDGCCWLGIADWSAAGKRE